MASGILSFGGYVPRTRLNRQSIADANSWFNPALKGLARGERSMANWDEDSITMAVEAARDCLTGVDRGSVAALYMASTSYPFQDRQNSGIVAEALRLDSGIQTMDIAASQRAGTSGLIAALQASAGAGGPVLVTGSEKRRTKAAHPLELTTGDGAAALLVGDGDCVATVLGYHTESVDFVDHYRGQDNAYDYVWEERWIRDEGYLKIVPDAAEKMLAKAGVAADAIDQFCFPAAARRVSGMIAKRLGIGEDKVRDNLQANMGESGVAHPLVMLVNALEEAGPGQKILVVGFGQGADAILVETTAALAKLPKRTGINGHLARRREETNYNKFLSFNELINSEHGLRAEVDRQSGMTTLYRNKDMILGLVGGKCTKCGTLQFPKSAVCVNPNCEAFHTQEDHSFAEMTGKMNSYTADSLTYSADPPAYYGMVQFDEGGRMMIDFTDITPGAKLDVGLPMRMMFRVKDYDGKRGFRRYFWKAAPIDNAD